MAISSTVAKQLCTKAELALFMQSLARNVKQLDAKSLRSCVTRSRKMRDKYHGLANRQDRESRGKQKAKSGRPAQGSAATRKKEQLFAESLARFEKQLAVVAKSKPKKAAKKTRVKKVTKKVTKKKPVKKAVKKKATAKKSVKKKATAKVKQTTPKKAAAKKTTAKKRTTTSARSKKAATAAKKTRRTTSGRMRIDKHLSAQGRRNQARRDKK